MNSVKKLSDENKMMLPDECEKMSDELWVIEIEWRKLSDEKTLPNQAIGFQIGFWICLRDKA